MINDISQTSVRTQREATSTDYTLYLSQYNVSHAGKFSLAFHDSRLVTFAQKIHLSIT